MIDIIELNPSVAWFSIKGKDVRHVAHHPERYCCLLQREGEYYQESIQYRYRERCKDDKKRDFLQLGSAYCEPHTNPVLRYRVEQDRSIPDCIFVALDKYLYLQPEGRYAAAIVSVLKGEFALNFQVELSHTVPSHGVFYRLGKPHCDIPPKDKDRIPDGI